MLVEEWQELRHDARLWLLVRYADLTVALRNMPPKEYMAVLIVGLSRLTVREAADVLMVHYGTVSRWYLRGIEWLTNYMNGEIDY